MQETSPWDDDELRRLAIARTVTWARRRLGPVRFEDLITGEEVSTRTYAQLVTRSVRRELEWAAEPCPRTSLPSPPPLVLEQVDPWASSPEALARNSTHVADCGHCRGAGEVSCGNCGGTTRARCRGCGGTGKIISFARKKMRTINCRDCQGRGTRKCLRCTSGRVQCSHCRGTGRMKRWIVVTERDRSHVGLHPDDRGLDAHPGLREDSDAAARWSGATLLESTHQSRQLRDTDLGPEARTLGIESKQGELEPALDARKDRITSQLLSVFRAPVVTTRFEFSARAGHLTLLGSTCEPTPVFDAAPFTSRLGWLTATALLLWMGVVWLQGLFFGRHAFYASREESWLVTPSLVGIAAGLYLLTAAWVRRRGTGTRRAPRLGWDRLGPSIALPSALTLGVLILVIQPSASELDRLTRAGELAQAELHAGALEARGENSAEYIAARSAFVLTASRLRANRDAVSFIAGFVASHQGTEAMEAERQRLREAWALAALKEGREQDVTAELEALAAEGAPDALLNTLRARLEEYRVRSAREQLTLGHLDEALAFLQRVQAPRLVPEPVAPILARIHRERAGACPERGLRCRSRELHLAATADPGTESTTVLAAFRASELARLQAAVRPEGRLANQLRNLETARSDAEVLLGDFPEDTELQQARGAIASRRAELLKDKHPYNEPLEVARALFGPTGMGETSPGVFKVASTPAGVLAFLFVEQGTVRGLYVVSADHEHQPLPADALQQVTRALVGLEFSPKALTRKGQGVAHLPTAIGKHSAVLGWKDDVLIEASIGKVTP